MRSVGLTTYDVPDQPSAEEPYRLAFSGMGRPRQFVILNGSAVNAIAPLVRL